MLKEITLLLFIFVATANAGEFENCRREGRGDAWRMWRGRRFRQDCDSSWDFRKDCEGVIDSDCTPQPWDSWREKSCKRGKAAGIREVIQQVEKMCLGDDTDQCAGLAAAAAEEVADTYCRRRERARVRGRRSRPDYRASCRRVAISECSGMVRSKVKSRCGMSPGTLEVEELQNKCTSKVDSLLGD